MPNFTVSLVKDRSCDATGRCVLEIQVGQELRELEVHTSSISAWTDDNRKRNMQVCKNHEVLAVALRLCMTGLILLFKDRLSFLRADPNQTPQKGSYCGAKLPLGRAL